MKSPIIVKIVTTVIVVLFTTKFCVGSKHAFGDPDADFIVKLCEKKLIDDSDNGVHKNYTIIFKFLGTTFQPIMYMEIDINKESTGDMIGSKAEHDGYWYRSGYSNYDATIHIKNATHVTANLTVYTLDLPQYLGELSLYSVTYVYVTNATATETPYARNTIGKRRKGDELIYFESRNVTNKSRFPSRVFQYSGSEYLTYVGFSFNSPTAMVLINSTFVKNQEFNAIVYDMNSEHFVVNMSIYGLKTMERPTNFSELFFTPDK